MCNYKNIWVLLMIIASFNWIQGQEHNTLDQEQNTSHIDHDKSHEDHKKHVLSASINHTVIFAGIKDESTKSITLPSFGLNYTYFFNNKWAIGLHNDIILEDFFVKENSSFETRSGSEEANISVIERGTPISVCIMGIYKPLPYLGLLAGVGREFSSHQDFTVIRFGMEAPFHLPHNWEVFGVLTYDINIDAYESLTYGIGLGKLF